MLLISSTLLPLAVSAQSVEKYCADTYALYKQHRGKEAEAILEQALRVNSNSVDLYYIRGLIRFHSFNRLTEAKLDFDKAISLNPQFAVAYAERATLQYKQKHFAESIADFTEAIKLRPEVYSNYESRANAYFAVAKYEQAIRDYSQCFQMKSDNLTLYYFRGLAYINLKKWAQALPDLNRAIEQEANADRYLSRAWVNFKLKRLPEALADYDKVVAVKTDEWGVYQTRGYIYEELKQYDAGIAQLNRSLQLHPGDGNTLEGRALCYQHLRQYDRAIADYTAALNGKPEFRARVYMRRGTVYQSKGNDAKAIEDYSAALKLDPKDRNALLQRASCHQALGSYSDALADYATMLKNNPSDREALMARAQCFVEVDSDDKAIADYTTIVDRAPQDGAALAARAEIHFNRSELDSAIEDETKITRQHPNAANAWRRRGYYRLIKGDLRNALADHNSALSLEPGENYILLSRALVHTALGNYSEAITDCNEVIKHEKGKTDEEAITDSTLASARKAKALSLMGDSADAAEQLQKLLGSQQELLRKNGELRATEESYRMACHLEAAVAKEKAEPTAKSASPETPPDEIDKSFRNRFATKHFLVMSDESQQRVIYYAQFAEAFRTFVDRNLIKMSDGPQMRVYLFTNREKLSDFAYTHQLSRIPYDSFYWTTRDTILIHGRQSVAPLALWIVNKAITLGLPNAEPWAHSGIPDLFMKFYGYFDGPTIVANYGYQTCSAEHALLSDLAALKLSNIVAMKDPKPLDPRARLLAVFLQVNQKLPEYLLRVHTGDKGKFETFVEAAFGATLAELEPKWNSYLCRTARNIKEWGYLPASEIFESKSGLTKFMQEKHIPMPDETIQPDVDPAYKPVAHMISRLQPNL